MLIAAAMLGAERLPLTGLNEQQRSILFDIRIPRILLGACVGASLAVAGAGLQALLRNPLAEPYLLGRLERRGVGDDGRVRAVSECRGGEAGAGICGSGGGDGRRLSDGEKPCGNER